MTRRLALLALLAGLPFHIHTVTLASGNTTQVTSGRVQDLLPAWPPL